PTPLYGTDIRSLDLRAGATLILAGLVAHGQTTISQAEIIDRGYERIDEKISELGGKIRRED
ncbi:MAG: UDP-N-acetylglucosamine 1-carboxyvinyltransferase, partial [Candidatus Heimdallarchaeota archaeon]